MNIFIMSLFLFLLFCFCFAFFLKFSIKFIQNSYNLKLEKLKEKHKFELNQINNDLIEKNQDISLIEANYNQSLFDLEYIRSDLVIKNNKLREIDCLTNKISDLELKIIRKEDLIKKLLNDNQSLFEKLNNNSLPFDNQSNYSYFDGLEEKFTNYIEKINSEIINLKNDLKEIIIEENNISLQLIEEINKDEVKKLFDRNIEITEKVTLLENKLKDFPKIA